jgi:CheY-like chemotaxis protein
MMKAHSARWRQGLLETILLVDDDPDLRSIEKLILEQGGYRTLAAADGPEALRIAKEYPGPIHLLVTDLVMPGMDGAELGRQIGSLRLGIPVLYVTAFAVAQLAGQEIVLKRIVLEPGVPILVKPFSIEALEQKVRDVLDQSDRASTAVPPDGHTTHGTQAAKAQANVEEAIQRAGMAHWAVRLERMSEGYTLTLQSGSRTFTRKGIDEAVLEDDWSSARGSLIRQARHELEPT